MLASNEAIASTVFESLKLATRTYNQGLPENDPAFGDDVMSGFVRDQSGYGDFAFLVQQMIYEQWPHTNPSNQSGPAPSAKASQGLKNGM